MEHCEFLAANSLMFLANLVTYCYTKYCISLLLWWSLRLIACSQLLVANNSVVLECQLLCCCTRDYLFIRHKWSLVCVPTVSLLSIIVWRWCYTRSNLANGET